LLFPGSRDFFAAGQKKNTAIYSGVPWFDDKGNAVSAHGANIRKDKGKYYLFGERVQDCDSFATHPFLSPVSWQVGL
jgi:hypothetical protein